MKTFKILQLTFLTLGTAFVISASVRMLFFLTSEINSFAQLLTFTLLASFILFLYYAILTMVIGLWKDTLTKKTI